MRGCVIYFWKIERLKQQIKAGELTEKHQFLYFLATAILSLIVANIASWAILLSFVPVKRNMVIWDYLLILSSFLILITGLFMSYHANGGAKGDNFLGRFTSISFVVWNRWAVFSLGLWFLVLTVELIIWGEVEPDKDKAALLETTYQYVLTWASWTIILYWRIWVHMKDLHKI